MNFVASVIYKYSAVVSPHIAQVIWSQFACLITQICSNFCEVVIDKDFVIWVSDVMVFEIFFSFEDQFPCAICRKFHHYYSAGSTHITGVISFIIIIVSFAIVGGFCFLGGTWTWSRWCFSWAIDLCDRWCGTRGLHAVNATSHCCGIGLCSNAMAVVDVRLWQIYIKTIMLWWISSKTNAITPIKKLNHPSKSIEYAT